jgi:flagellar basal body P-ring protein FlgI
MKSWLRLACCVAAIGLGACEQLTEQEQVERPITPPPTYTGPEYFRTTIGSLGSLIGYESTLVSGYGLVVNLNGTGSGDVPPELRQWLIDEMAKRGFGRFDSGMPNVTPEQVLNSGRAAVVMVEGLIPPGAVEGTRFDLLVSALPSTQTTSLEYGTLYTTDLRVNGAAFGAPQFSNMANGKGAVFINPFADPTSQGPGDDPRVGRVPWGGQCTVELPIQIVVNQPSYRMTTQIANRINGRIPQATGDRLPVAVAKSDSIIDLHIPRRYRDNTSELVELIAHLYLNPQSEFAARKADELARAIQDPANAAYIDRITYAWEGLGKTILPTLRDLYTHPDAKARLAALKAGAKLEDVRAADGLFDLARWQAAPLSEQATRALGTLLRQRPDNHRVAKMLTDLLDGKDSVVRVAAMECLYDVRYPVIEINQFPDKVELLRVKCNNPMIYVSRTGVPRIAIFNDRLAFRQPTLFSAWDNRFMLRSDNGSPQATLFYQPIFGGRPAKLDIPANVPYMVGTMAFTPDLDSKSPGLDMSYSQIVNVLYQMTRSKQVEAPLVLQRDSIYEQILASRLASTEGRPETSGPAEPVSNVPAPLKPIPGSASTNVAPVRQPGSGSYLPPGEGYGPPGLPIQLKPLPPGTPTR